MDALASTYFYLATGLALVALAMVLLVLNPRERKPGLLSGCLATLSAPWSAILEREYWHPPRVVAGPTGLEDIVYSFGLGIVAWIVVAPLTGLRLSFRPRLRTVLQWVLISLVFGTSLFALLRLGGTPVMPAVVAAMVAQALWLVALRPHLWRFPTVGGVLFPLVHLGLVRVVFWLWPHAREEWSLAQLSGMLIAGVPAEEILWAFGFGVLWPLLVVFLLDGRVRATPAVD